MSEDHTLGLACGARREADNGCSICRSFQLERAALVLPSPSRCHSAPTRRNCPLPASLIKTCLPFSPAAVSQCAAASQDEALSAQLCLTWAAALSTLAAAIPCGLPCTLRGCLPSVRIST